MLANRHQKSRLVVVSNRLPFYKTQDKDGNLLWKQAPGGLVTALDPVLRKTHGVWLGWDGAYSPIVPEEAPQEPELIDVRNIQIQDRLFGETKGYYSVGSIPITQEEADLYYSRFSNGVLWALFHYFFEKCSLDDNSWHTYSAINGRFAAYIERVATPDDVVWIQDFHLFLVPFFLRQRRPAQRIHFFLHIPFPHIDIFSIIPWQKQILESLLCCNTVGFHHRQYARNALEAVDIYNREKTEASGVTSETESIRPNFYVSPISIDFHIFSETSKKQEVLQRKDEIRRQAGVPKLILGVDRLDYSKGIKERLRGIEHLLDHHPELKGQFSYYQLAVPCREELPAYRYLKREVDELIGRINGRFSTGTWHPIHYIYSAISFEELIAFYSAADVGLITPLRDGMNLVCKEFIASHSDGDGVLILSRFAGAIADIRNCLAVNPYSIEDISDRIYEALLMPESKRREKMRRMRRNIRTNNIQAWMKRCFELFEEPLISQAAS